MKHRILVCLLPIIFMVSCSILGVGYIEFVGSRNLAFSTCWIKVVGNSSQEVYFLSPTFRNAEEELREIFDLPRIDRNDRIEGIVYHQTQAQILNYAVTDQGYWFR